MKKFYLFIISILFMMCPIMVNAASATITVSASNTVMVGNTVTVTVKLSSGSYMGAWEANITYDKNYLQLTKSTTESGGTSISGYATNGVGEKSKSYTLTFKALKSGSTTVSVNSYAIWDYSENKMTTTSSSKKITLKTKEEIEASYSSNAYLKSITVGEYSLSPEFDKKTYEYNVEVENEIENVNVSATKEDSSASISGTGDITLTEGNNKVILTVTAEKGNSLTYTININRKELDPITVNFENENYTIVRKSDALVSYSTFEATTITYEGTEIPALKSDITGITLIGLKDSNGDIADYIYEDGTLKEKYVEVKGNSLTIMPLELKENDLFKNYIKTTTTINDIDVECYKITEDSKYVIVYAQNIETGDIAYYSYNIDEGSAQLLNKEIEEKNNKTITNYKYVLLGELVIIIILLFIIIMRKPSKKKIRKQELKEIIEEHIDEEIENEVEEQEKEEIADEQTEESEEEKKELTKKELKKLKKEQKREEKRRKEFDF